MWGQEPAGKEAAGKDPAAKPAPETVEAKLAPISIYESIKTRVESPEVAELRTNMDVFTTLIVEEVVKPGTIVKQGDVVLQFKTDKIEQQLKDAQHELMIAELSLKEAENNLEETLRTFDLDHQLAQQKWDEAQQDIDYYLKVTAPFAERQAAKRLESSGFQVEYAQDELDQLEKMYKEDELTEESELIVLKRAQRSLDQSKFFYESAKIDVDHTLQVELPRAADKQKQALERGELEYQKAMISLPSQRQLKELEFQKQKSAYDKQQRDFAKLQSDYEKMTLRAPIDGIVYHGQSRRGTWANVAGGNSRSIEPNVTLPKDIVVITIVAASNYRLRGELDERQLGSIQKGRAGVAVPAAEPTQTFAATVSEIGSVPVDEGKFDCVLTVGQLPSFLVPGMNCDVKLKTYEKKDAVLVPKASVFSDDDGLSHYVFVSTESGNEQRGVKTGKTKDDKIEIVEGLKAGDKILKAKPE
jgi:multidrug efflux pump subunit AcrA (membrane-fusion protein)